MIEKTKSMRNLTSKKLEEVFALFTICKVDKTYPKSFIYSDHPDWESKDKDEDGNSLIGLEVVMASDNSDDEWMSDKAYTVLRPSHCIERGFTTEGFMIFTRTGKPGFVRIYPSRYYFEIFVDANVVCSGDYYNLSEEQKRFLDEFVCMAIVEGDPKEKNYHIDLDKIMEAFGGKCKKQNYSRCSSYHLFIKDMDTLRASGEDIDILIKKMQSKQEEINKIRFDVVFLRTVQQLIKIDLCKSQYLILPIESVDGLFSEFERKTKGIDFCNGLDSTMIIDYNSSDVESKSRVIPKMEKSRTMFENNEREELEKRGYNIECISKLVDIFGDNPSVSFIYPYYYPSEKKRLFDELSSSRVSF